MLTLARPAPPCCGVKTAENCTRPSVSTCRLPMAPSEPPTTTKSPLCEAASQAKLAPTSSLKVKVSWAASPAVKLVGQPPMLKTGAAVSTFTALPLKL
jgi:hypothetical protein